SVAPGPPHPTDPLTLRPSLTPKSPEAPLGSSSRTTLILGLASSPDEGQASAPGLWSPSASPWRPSAPRSRRSSARARPPRPAISRSQCLARGQATMGDGGRTDLPDSGPWKLGLLTCGSSLDHDRPVEPIVFRVERFFEPWVIPDYVGCCPPSRDVRCVRHPE